MEMANHESSQATRDSYNNRLHHPFSGTSKFDDLYPERKGKPIEHTYFDLMMGKGRPEMAKDRCGADVVKCLEKWPLIRLMLGALKSQGCITDLTERHLSCEMCTPGRNSENVGGFDELNNQIVLCANNARFGLIHAHMIKTLVSMYDVCTRKTDFQNIDHLACMEVRKANLADCNFLSYLHRSDANFAITDQHAVCVKNVATKSLDIKLDNRELSEKAISRVFHKCYNDLEPIGRRCTNSADMYRAYHERYLFGYD